MISSLYSRRHCCAAVQTNLPSRHLLLSGTHRIQGVSKANQTHSVSKANKTHSQDIQLPFYEPALDNVFLLNVLAPEFYV